VPPFQAGKSSPESSGTWMLNDVSPLCFGPRNDRRGVKVLIPRTTPDSCFVNPTVFSPRRRPVTRVELHVLQGEPADGAGQQVAGTVPSLSGIPRHAGAARRCRSRSTIDATACCRSRQRIRTTGRQQKRLDSRAAPTQWRKRTARFAEEATLKAARIAASAPRWNRKINRGPRPW